jgi:hypothetical protein
MPTLNTSSIKSTQIYLNPYIEEIVHNYKDSLLEKYANPLNIPLADEVTTNSETDTKIRTTILSVLEVYATEGLQDMERETKINSFQNHFYPKVQDYTSNVLACTGPDDSRKYMEIERKTLNKSYASSLLKSLPFLIPTAIAANQATNYAFDYSITGKISYIGTLNKLMYNAANNYLSNDMVPNQETINTLSPWIATDLAAITFATGVVTTILCKFGRKGRSKARIKRFRKEKIGLLSEKLIEELSLPIAPKTKH